MEKESKRIADTYSDRLIYNNPYDSPRSAGYEVSQDQPQEERQCPPVQSESSKPEHDGFSQPAKEQRRPENLHVIAVGHRIARRMEAPPQEFHPHYSQEYGESKAAHHKRGSRDISTGSVLHPHLHSIPGLPAKGSHCRIERSHLHPGVIPLMQQRPEGCERPYPCCQ